MEVVEDPAPLGSAVVLTAVQAPSSLGSAQPEEHREKLRTDSESLRPLVQGVRDAALWRGAEWRQGPGRLAAMLGIGRPRGLKEIEEAASAVATAGGSEGGTASAPSPLPGQAPWPSVAHQARGAVEGRLQPRPSPLGAGTVPAVPAAWLLPEHPAGRGLGGELSAEQQAEQHRLVTGWAGSTSASCTLEQLSSPGAQLSLSIDHGSSI